jgi:hypothetical protein
MPGAGTVLGTVIVCGAGGGTKPCGNVGAAMLG